VSYATIHEDIIEKFVEKGYRCIDVGAGLYLLVKRNPSVSSDSWEWVVIRRSLNDVTERSIHIRFYSSARAVADELTKYEVKLLLRYIAEKI